MTSSPGSGAVRACRAGVLAVLTLALAGGGHLLGGGGLPGPGGLALVLAPMVGLSLALTGRRLGAVAILGSLGVGQAAMHAAFTALATPASAAPTMAGHVHAEGAAVAIGHVMSGMPSPLADPRMLTWHALATLVTGALLLRGERALWALWAAVRPRDWRVGAIGVPTRALLTVAVPRVPWPDDAWVRPPRRGPPLPA
jgi:hypothetical protein